MMKRKRISNESALMMMYSNTSNRLESLSNELLLEIFEYLDAYNLYQAFHGLNHRINTLLQLANLHIIQDSEYTDESIWNSLRSYVNPSHIRIISYKDDSETTDEFLTLAKGNLHSIYLHHIPAKSLERIRSCLPIDNEIKCLYIKEQYDYLQRGLCAAVHLILVDHTYQFTSLINLSLKIAYHTEFPLVSVTFPQLRRLSITDCYWSSNVISFLKDRTPNLRSLKFCGYSHSNLAASTFTVPQLRELHIRRPNEFDELKVLLTTLSGLRRLHIQWTDIRQYEMSDQIQWMKAIEKYSPHLKQLTIDFPNGAGEEIAKSLCKDDTWSTKKVNVKMTVNKVWSRCPLVKTIYFGQEWCFGYFNNFET